MKYSFYWSISIVITICALNFHILILNGYQGSQIIEQNITDSLDSSSYKTIKVEIKDPTFKCYYYSPTFHLETYWNVVNMLLYSFIPSAIMIIFTSLLVHKTLKSGSGTSENSIAAKTFNKKKRVTMSLVTVSIAYMVMTLPSTFFFAFIYEYIPLIPWGRYFDDFVDFVSFANHASIFFSSFFTNARFRQCFFRFINTYLFKCQKDKKYKESSMESTLQ